MFGCVRESKIMKNNCIPQQIANRDLATDSNRNTDQNGTQCPHTASPPTQPVAHSCNPSQSDPESTVPDQKSQIKIQKSHSCQDSVPDNRPHIAKRSFLDGHLTSGRLGKTNSCKSHGIENCEGREGRNGDHRSNDRLGSNQS